MKTMLIPLFIGLILLPLFQRLNRKAEAQIALQALTARVQMDRIEERMERIRGRMEQQDSMTIQVAQVAILENLEWRTQKAAYQMYVKQSNR